MDYFENIIKTLLEAEGYWVRQSFKIDLTKDEKVQIGKPSIPRPEIDLLALHHSRNELLALEAKSFLDSPGVRLSELRIAHDVPEGRYKLFTSERYRSVVMEGLRRSLLDLHMIDSKTKIILGLAAGKVYQNMSDAVAEFMKSNNWVFWSPQYIKDQVTKLAERGYENDPTIIAAKILSR